MNSSLLLGWPNYLSKSSSRPFERYRKARKYGNLARAEKYHKEGHLVTFAPTGSGKGVGVIIPNLLHYGGPIIVIDPKAENFYVTANYRRKILGQRIFLLDPFEVVPESMLAEFEIPRACLNPIDLVSAFGKHIEPQITMIASILAGEGAIISDENKFWDQEALKLVAGIVAVSISEAKAKGKNATFQEFIDHFFTDDLVYNLAVILDKDKGKPEEHRVGDFAYKAIAAFLQKADKERSGVVSTAQSYLTPFISRAVNHYLNSSTLSPKDLSDRDDYTVYVVIPPSKLVSHAVLLRLWISTIMNTIMERGASPLKKTLFLLDECAQLGSLNELRVAVTLLRGYGLQVWMFFQDLAQLKGLYSDWETLVHNCGIIQAFGLSKKASAEPISKIVGRYSADEIAQLDRTQQIVLESNMPCRILTRMNYLTDPAFRLRSNTNIFFSNRVKRAVFHFPPNLLKFHY